MKVRDIMEQNVISASPSTSVNQIANIIFGHEITAVPVIDTRGKLVGIVSETDILDNFFPIEKLKSDGTNKVLSSSAEEIMSPKVITVESEANVSEAYSIMEKNKIVSLPVLDKNAKVIGIISKTDIFKSIVDNQFFSSWGQEEFHEWLATYFDKYVSWQKRLIKEIAFIKYQLKGRSKKIIDVGCGTGEHSIALARQGFEVLGIDKSSSMIAIANNKLESLPEKLRKKVSFRKVGTDELADKLNEKFDAAIILGGVISHYFDLAKYLKGIQSVLNSTNTIIIQVPNYEHILEEKNRFSSLSFIKPSPKSQEESALLSFFDFRDDGLINLNTAEFEFIGKTWETRGVATTVLKPYTKRQLILVLKKLNYTKIESARDRSHAMFNPDEEKSGLFIVAKI